MHRAKEAGAAKICLNDRLAFNKGTRNSRSTPSEGCFFVLPSLLELVQQYPTQWKYFTEICESYPIGKEGSAVLWYCEGKKDAVGYGKYLLATV